MREQSSQARSRSLLSDYTADLGNFVSRRRVEAIARAAAAEAKIARRASAKAVARAGQEMKSPIDVIAAYCDLIRTHAMKNVGERQQASYIEHISRAAAQLREIAQRLESYDK
jgi:hypothetical protein